jgi:glycolate oxidase iron-sulfur subunit
MACETACPSGVRYAPLVEQTRAAIEEHYRRPFVDRLFRGALFAVLPHPARLRVLALPLAAVRWLRRFPGVLRLLPRTIANLIALAPDAATGAGDIPPATSAAGPVRLRVGLLTGCVQRVFFGDVNEATVRVLSAEGCEVYAPAGQGCCGALALHAGRDGEARDFARRLIAVFEACAPSPPNSQGPPDHHRSAGLDHIVVNAAGCGSTMKMYGELLKDDPAWAGRAAAFSARVRDVTETLAGLLPPRAARTPIHARVAYHDACHLAHAQGIRREPRELVASIPGITIVPVAEADICCGSAGIFNLVQPEMAGTLGRRKAAHLAGSGAEMVVTTNPGCLLQIRAAGRAAGQDLPVVHVVQLLDRATGRVPPE